MTNRILWLTVSDRLFFPGTLAAVNSIRHYHPESEITVISSGKYKQPLTDAQRRLLTQAGIRVRGHQEFDKPGRVLGAWQLKAYAACDLSDNADLIIGFDSDAVLCSNIDDIIEQSLGDACFRGGKDGDGCNYGPEFAPYGFEVPVRNPIYMSTSLYLVPLNEANRRILRDWASACDKAAFGRQSEKLYPGHGDQGVLNAVIFKHTRSANVKLLENHLFSQHWVYHKDIINFEDGFLINKSIENARMRAFHCGGSAKFWSPEHSKFVKETGQNQMWSYAHWLRMLWFGPHTDWSLDPYQWLAQESHHLCGELAYHYHPIEALDRSGVRAKWEGMTGPLLERITQGIQRAMSIGGSMTQYIRLARSLPDHCKIVEVGSFFGGSVVTLAVALLHRQVSITSVESFMGDLNGTVDGLPLPQPSKFIENVKICFPHLNINTLPLDSANAAGKFADGSLDMVFIDGNHSTQAVLRDIDLWRPKLKRGGILAGDDIGWKSVRMAVEQKFGANYQSGSDLWWIVNSSI